MIRSRAYVLSWKKLSIFFRKVEFKRENSLACECIGATLLIADRIEIDLEMV